MTMSAANRIIERGMKMRVTKKTSLKFIDGVFITKFDPDQPRDEAGRFSSDGSGGGVITEEQSLARSEALAEYTGSYYQMMNGVLRGNLDSEIEPSQMEKVQSNIKAIEAIIEDSAPLSETTTMYRGINGSIANDFRSLEVGDTFSDKAFTSATTNTSIADKFGSSVARSFDTPYVKLVIEVPEGTKAINVDSYVDSKYISGTGYHEGGLTSRQESEFILPRDATFEVTKNEGNNLYVRLLDG